MTASPHAAPSTSPPADAVEQPSRRWPLTRSWVAVMVGALGALVAAGVALGTIVTRIESGAFGTVDRAFNLWVEGRRTPFWNAVTDVGSGFSDAVTVIVVLPAVAALFFALWRRWDEVVLLASALTLEVGAFVTTAFIVGRDRPPVEQLDPSPPTASFPSGHTAAAVALYFGLAFIVSRHTSRTWVRVGAYALATLIASAVALSRLYRGMHHPSDVVVGAALGALCLYAAVRALRTGRRSEAGGAP